MNFATVFQKGKEGLSKGLRTGLPKLDKAINLLQKKMTIGVAAAPKCGKTTLVDFCFVIMPFLQLLAEGRLDKIEWIYFSFEIDRISKEFKFAAFFMAHDYGIWNFFYKGELQGMDSQYLMGKKVYRWVDEKGVEQEELIPVSPEHEEMLKKIYVDRIQTLFGTYDEHGVQVGKGLITFIGEADNPTGMNKFLLAYAKNNGTFLEQPYTVMDDNGKLAQRKRVYGYTEKDPDKFTVIVTDHIRKLKRERGFTMKENIDKWLEYSTYLRNMCQFTFIHVVHSGRQLANMERLRYAGETIFPTSDDTKDSGNVAEECTILMTLFNPNDEKYNLKKHFNVNLADYPFYRSLHITESRDTDCPQHIQLNMFGGVNYFEQIGSLSRIV